ncbi:m-AAA protease-interacting protein 1, mitochondrial [Arctopsyche grandis]|uniref:m-AAA protease-interacting protein 1, mitochondrial n=1 Tax=Arctopsyche grandis TaxID=121162 RepID=UPI00406D7235
MELCRLIVRASVSRSGWSCRRLLSGVSPPPPPPPRQRPSTAKLMDFPPLMWPSFVLSCKNFIYTHFIIRPHFDPDFNIHQFIEGSKQALHTISSALSESDFGTVKELVSEEAYSELYYSVSEMSLGDRENILVDKEDVYLCFPYQIGIIFNNENDKRWVEITMVYHSLRGLSKMKQRGETPSISFGPAPEEYAERLYICNYRFIREYTKGVDSSWIVNVVNHFRDLDIAKRW